MSATDDGTRGPPTDAAVSDEVVTDSDGAEELTLVEAVCDGLHTEMARDDSVMVLGEDVGKNGGVFRATEALYEEYGADRGADNPRLGEGGVDDPLLAVLLV